MDKALELWKRLFAYRDDSYFYNYTFEYIQCFFCAKEAPKHEPDCIWVEAKKLVEENKE